jgi:sugar phosphate isomerase/epimerase
MTRRDLLYATGAALLYPRDGRPAESAAPPCKLGIATTSYMTVLRPRDTYQFLEHCHELGAAGIQSQISGDLPKLRARAEQLGMFIEAMVPLPKGNGSTDAFEKNLQNAKAVGATCVRAGSLGGRRYETFSTLAEYQDWVKQSDAGLDAAVRLLEKYKIPLGLENHKDRTVDQLVAVLKRYSSEYLGACVDCGNNISLLDEPMEVIEKLVPHAVTTHFKDMAVAPFKSGFLLSEVPLGQGFLDMPRIASMIQSAKPKTHLMLEMITRDPLVVPCLTDKYWATFPDRNGIYLARTLTLVQEKESSKPLPRISQLPHDQQLRVEEENVKTCLEYARKNLA